MCEQKKHDKLQPMVLQISKYLRYYFKDNMSLVTLAEELEYVENYVALQKDSMLQQVQYTVDVEEHLKRCHIPVLVVQTFVEHSFKYAQKQGDILKIHIKIIKLETEDKPFLDISISDNGNGFSNEILNYINHDTMIEHRQNQVGISNVKQRLLLLYGEDGVVQCSNYTNGAQCEIIFPFSI